MLEHQFLSNPCSKFNVSDQNPVSKRWKDLLLTEYLALETLWQGGVLASESSIIDYSNQSFLQIS
ncbi:MAG: hypothetical protein ACI8PW_000239 [Methylophilaceae bacterium]|jgi:hypothetical protein